MPLRIPTVALNLVLSEVIDMVQDVKQAHRKVAETHAVHDELDRLNGDLREWGRLIDQDEAFGVSALATIPSVAGRRPPNLWPGPSTDEDVQRIIGGHRDRLAQLVARVLAEQGNEASRRALADVQWELVARRQALA